ncbi:protein BatD [bacterium]|nr:protein BatD [bacterium]
MKNLGIRIAVLLMLLPVSLLSGDISFTAYVSQKQISLGEAIQLTLSLQGDLPSRLPQPEIPDLENEFSILGSSSSTSSSISIINGKVTSTKTKNFIYYIQPKHEGKLTIPSARINIKGRTYKTEPITVTVSKGAAAPKTTGQGASPPTHPTPRASGKDIFVSAYADKKTAYVGEQITVYFTLYTRLSVARLSVDTEPRFENCWTKDIFQAEKLSYRTEVVDGIRYNAALLRKTAVFPITDGTITITPMQLVGEVYTRSRGFFDFFGTTRSVSIVGNPLKIKVLPLPSEGKPSSFSGGVGQFSISSSLDNPNVKTNEAFTLRVRVRGTGNIHSIPPPKVNLPPDLELFDTQTKDNIKIEGNKLTGSKLFEFIIIPRSEGEFEIPPVLFSYFDPKSKSYRTIKTRSLTVMVEKGEKIAQGERIFLPTKSGVKTLGKDIEFIKPDKEKLTSYPLYPRYTDLIFVAVAEVALLLLSFFIARRRRRLLEDEVYAKLSRAYSRARKGLKKAQELARKREIDAAYGLISETLEKYISERLLIPWTNFNEVASRMEEQGFTREETERLRHIIDGCYASRFSPGASDEAKLDQLIKSAKQLINCIEKRA